MCGAFSNSGLAGAKTLPAKRGQTVPEAQPRGWISACGYAPVTLASGRVLQLQHSPFLLRPYNSLAGRRRNGHRPGASANGGAF
jgi:hypothetical protein